MTAPMQEAGQRPKGILCRRGAAIRWLQISEEEWDELVAARVVTKRYTNTQKQGRAWFLIEEIDRKIYQPMTKGESV